MIGARRMGIRNFLALSALLFACAGPAFAAPPSLDQRLQALKDRAEIRAVLAEYIRLLDEENFVGYSNLFARTGVWEGNVGSATGPAEIRRMLELTFKKIPAGGGHKGAYHVLSSISIQLDGDRATSWSRWVWFVPSPRGTPTGERSGHYEDTLVREEGHWRFQHRLTVTELPTPQDDKEKAIWRSDYNQPAAPAK